MPERKPGPKPIESQQEASTFSDEELLRKYAELNRELNELAKRRQHSDPFAEESAGHVNGEINIIRKEMKSRGLRPVSDAEVAFRDALKNLPDKDKE